MKVIALVLAILMALVYVKSVKNLFKSVKKIRKEQFESLDKMINEGGMSKESNQIMLFVSMFIVFLFSTSYYIITASVIGSLGMIVYAGLMIVISFTSWSKMIKYIATEDKSIKLFTWSSKPVNLAGLIYLTLFFVLFFTL